MFNANYFTYDGIMSAQFGLQIASFDENGALQETSVFSPSITTNKSKNMKRFYATNVNINEPPQIEVTLVCEKGIDKITKRQVIAWLSKGQDFKKLVIHQTDMEDFCYMCKFQDISELTIGSVCVGFTMTALMNSPYQYGNDTVVTKQSANYDNYRVVIRNASDILDDYIYPKIEFTLASGSNHSISVINETDDSAREFKMSNLPEGVKIVVDNELRIIDGAGVLLSNVEKKNWIRLKEGDNVLRITLKGEFSIICPQYMNVGY